MPKLGYEYPTRCRSCGVPYSALTKKGSYTRILQAAGYDTLTEIDTINTDEFKSIVAILVTKPDSNNILAANTIPRNICGKYTLSIIDPQDNAKRASFIIISSTKIKFMNSTDYFLEVYGMY